MTDERALAYRQRQQGGRHASRPQDETAESLWEESHSFDFSQTPVVPSDPDYPQVAQDLMTASPPRRNSTEGPDFRRMSDASTSVDPRRVSDDSGVESSKAIRSQPSTPVAQTLTSVRTEGTSSPEPHPSLQGEFLDSHSLPSTVFVCLSV